jgi:hypothetical protein
VGEVYLVKIDFHSILLDVRSAFAIWSVLIAVGATPFVVMSASARRRWKARPRRAQRRIRPVREPAAARDEELRRYAEEVAVAASRAAVTAERRRADWSAVLRTQQATWRAYDEATVAAQRAIQAEAFGIPDSSPDPEELAARRRHLERAAAAAYRRGELTVEQFGDVLAQRGGWDPRLHPFAQETRLCVLRRDRLRRACKTLSEVEHDAWQAAEVALAAKRSLENEATSAALRLRQTQVRPQRTVRPVGARRPAGRPRQAVPAVAWNADTAPIPRPVLT